MIEPSQAYTVQRRACLPPKDKRTPGQKVADYQAPIIANLGRMPSIWEDANRIRKRHGSRFGHHNSEAARNDANEARRVECEERREKLAGEILADLRKHPLTTAEIIKRQGVTENAVKQAMKLLRDRNQAILTRVGLGRVWEVVA